MSTLRELRAVLRVLREYGVLQYKCGDVELSLNPGWVGEPRRAQRAGSPAEDAKPVTPGAFSEDELEALFYHERSA